LIVVIIILFDIIEVFTNSQCCIIWIWT